MKTKSLLLSALLMTSVGLAQIPTNGLIGYYPFSGNANDYSTGGNNGTVNGAKLTADRFGSPNSAYYFNGTSDYIDFAKAPFITDVNFSISVWIKRDTLSIGHHFPTVGIGFNGQTGNAHELNTGIISTNGNEDIVLNVPGYYALRADTNVTTDKWMHLVVTKKAVGLTTSTVDFYLNGVKIYNKQVTGNSSNIFPLINKMVIGKQQGTGGLSFAHGAIDDIRIYDRAIDPNEVHNLYYKDVISTQDICSTVGKDSATLFKNGYGLGHNLGQAEFSPCEQNTWTKSKWINVKGVDSLIVQTRQHRLYDTSKIYDKNNQLIWKWNGEDTGIPTWYTRKHNLFVGGNDSVRIEFHQGYPSFCGGIQIIKLICENTCYKTIYDTIRVTVTDTLLINTILTNIDPTKETTIKIYPNPTNSQITISCDNVLLDGYSITISNAIGQTVYTSPITQSKTTINLSSWTGKGIYFVHLLNKNQTIDVRKIVLQ